MFKQRAIAVFFDCFHDLKTMTLFHALTGYRHQKKFPGTLLQFPHDGNVQWLHPIHQIFCSVTDTWTMGQSYVAASKIRKHAKGKVSRRRNGEIQWTKNFHCIWAPNRGCCSWLASACTFSDSNLGSRVNTWCIPNKRRLNVRSPTICHPKKGNPLP